MSNTLTLSGAPHQAVVRPAPPAVYADGARRRDLKVLSLELLGPPTFARVELELQADYQTAGRGIESVGQLPPVGSPMTIFPSGPGGGLEVPAVVTCHRAALKADGEHLLAEVEHALSRELSATITRRWHVQDGTAVAVSAAVCFNDGHDGLACANPVTVGARSARLFDTSAAAKRWSVADALAYLLAVAAPATVQSPSRQELEDLAGAIDLGRLDVSGMQVAWALAAVAARGGLAIRAAREGLGLVFYRPAVGGRRVTVGLQPRGERLDAARTNLWRGAVSFRRRPSRRPVLAVGTNKRYESTFLMSPGWDGSLQTSRWRDFVRSMSPNWPLLADVYRKWALNEHGWYSGDPWRLAVGDLSPVSRTDFVLHRPRALLPCLSCDASGQSLGVVVETRLGQDHPWLRWRGALWVSRDECAVYLGGDGLPGEFFQAAVAGDAQVRVTATVESDSRLSAELPGDEELSTRLIDASYCAGWSKVQDGSIFLGREDLGPPAERDDTALLQSLAERDAEVISAATQAELVLGWVDTSYSVGDRVEVIEGRGLELMSAAAVSPTIRSVHHDFTVGQCTTIRLEG